MRTESRWKKSTEPFMFQRGKGFWRTLLAYSGPGALVAVGYMDPGNWQHQLLEGQNFQYLLMSIILLSSLIAMLLQYMAAKLGIVTQMDLAQAIRARTSRTLGIILWLLTENGDHGNGYCGKLLGRQSR